MEPDSRTDDLPPNAQISEEEMAAARRSLAAALRLSFVVLSVCMLGVVGLFAISGCWEIETGQVGVKLLFGEILGEGDDRIVQPGLRWTWPEPIGRIEKVTLKQRKLEIKDFWMYETPEDAAVPLSKRRPASQGLRPGWDGSLLTGDRALVHVKFTCKYYTGTRNKEPATDQIINYLRNVGDKQNAIDVVPNTEEILRSAVADAAIRAAALMTVDRIVTTGRKEFTDEVTRVARGRLAKMKAGIEIAQIEMATSVPLAAIKAFTAVTSARQQQADTVNNAKAQAARILNNAAGDAWAEFAGDPERATRAGLPDRRQRRQIFAAYVEAVKGADAAAVDKQRELLRQFGLLRLYSEAREDGNAKLAGEVLAEINDVLASNRLGHAAARVINEAEAYRGTIRQRVAADVDRFNKLVDEFARSPELIMHQLWVAVKTDILSRPTNETFYLTPSQKVVLRLSRDPRDRREALRKLLEAKKDQSKTGAKTWSPPTPTTPRSSPEH